jgi:hypothetical protein
MLLFKQFSAFLKRAVQLPIDKSVTKEGELKQFRVKGEIINVK